MKMLNRDRFTAALSRKNTENTRLTAFPKNGDVFAAASAGQSPVLL